MESAHNHTIPIESLFAKFNSDSAKGLTNEAVNTELVMKQKPRNPSEPLLKTKQWYVVWIYAAVISVCTLSAVGLSHYLNHVNENFDPNQCNNILFFTLILCQLLHVFNMASVKIAFYKSEVFRNRYVWYSLIASTIIILSVFFIPQVGKALHVQALTIGDWFLVFASAITSLLAIQILKCTKIINDED